MAILFVSRFSECQIRLGVINDLWSSSKSSLNLFMCLKSLIANRVQSRRKRSTKLLINFTDIGNSADNKLHYQRQAKSGQILVSTEVGLTFRSSIGVYNDYNFYNVCEVEKRATDIWDVVLRRAQNKQTAGSLETVMLWRRMWFRSDSSAHYITMDALNDTLCHLSGQWLMACH